MYEEVSQKPFRGASARPRSSPSSRKARRHSRPRPQQLITAFSALSGCGGA